MYNKRDEDNTNEIKTVRKSKHLSDEVRSHIFLIFVFLTHDMSYLYNVWLLNELIKMSSGDRPLISQLLRRSSYVQYLEFFYKVLLSLPLSLCIYSFVYIIMNLCVFI